MGGTGSEAAGEGVSDAAAADPDATDEVEPAGRFRIYLGAAPGVGKTFAMLSEGHRRQERGADVVAGFVEAYGRPVTEELIDGLEVIGNVQGASVFFKDDRYRLAASGGVGLREHLDGGNLYPAFTRAYAESLYYAPVPVVRPLFELRTELVSRQRADLSVENYDRYLADVFLLGVPEQSAGASAKEDNRSAESHSSQLEATGSPLFLNNALLANNHAVPMGDDAQPVVV